MPLFQTAIGRTGQLTGKPLGIKTGIGNHAFRTTGITAYLNNSVTGETAQHIANHEPPRMTKFYDRRQDGISFDEVERILIRTKVRGRPKSTAPSFSMPLQDAVQFLQQHIVIVIVPRVSICCYASQWRNFFIFKPQQGQRLVPPF